MCFFMMDIIFNEVKNLLENDKSGHDINHIRRVLLMSSRFALAEGADANLVELISLLHDVDDYKLFGSAAAEMLLNARRIMDKAGVDLNTQKIVCHAIKQIGFQKRLMGIVPDTLEGMVVSDADMCDAMGATGIIRTHAYGMSHNRIFFDPMVNPTSITSNGVSSSISVCHFFEKLLMLDYYMLTESGKNEAIARKEIMINFLKHLFLEEETPEWANYLDNYLKVKKRSWLNVFYFIIALKYVLNSIFTESFG